LDGERGKASFEPFFRRWRVSEWQRLLRPRGAQYRPLSCEMRLPSVADGIDQHQPHRDYPLARHGIMRKDPVLR